MYGSRYSLLVTHATTNPPIGTLYMGERTGTLTACHLWPYMKDEGCVGEYVMQIHAGVVVRRRGWTQGDDIN